MRGIVSDRELLALEQVEDVVGECVDFKELQGFLTVADLGDVLDGTEDFDKFFDLTVIIEDLSDAV